jgi:chromosome segregation ATPase
LRELEAKNVSLENEKETLQKELSSRGDVQGQHAQEIQQLSEKNKLEVEKLQQENLKEIQELQKQIADKDAQIQSNLQKIQTLEQQIVEKDKKIADFEATCGVAQQEQQQNATAIQSANDKIAQLENEKSVLQKMNDDLIKRIIAATEAINNATSQLEELTNQAFYDKSNQDVSAIINEIEASLQQIINTIQGNTNTATPNPSVSLSGPRQSNQSTPEQRNRNINMNGNQSNLNFLLSDLKNKSNDVIRNTGQQNNKYINAYDFIDFNLASNPNMSEDELNMMVKSALSQNGIQLYGNFNKVKGGYNMSLKKTKKYNKKAKSHHTRKQKGGYLWGNQKSSSIKSMKGNRSFRKASRK